MLAIDHVLVMVRNLDAAHERFANQYGLESQPGGRHPGHGTGNRIIPLNDEYIELMAVVDPEEARGSPLGQWVSDRVERREGPALLCLRTDDIEPVAEARGLVALPMSRRGADGTTIAWRLGGLERALVDPSLPFFIQWDVPRELHPGRIEVSHPAAPSAISWVGITGDEEGVRGWVRDDSLPLRFTSGEPGVTSVGIATATGELVIR